MVVLVCFWCLTGVGMVGFACNGTFVGLSGGWVWAGVLLVGGGLILVVGGWILGICCVADGFVGGLIWFWFGVADWMLDCMGVAII